VKAVTVLLRIPSCASRVVSVAAIMVYGRAEDMPRKNAASGAVSVYGRIDGGTRRRQPIAASVLKTASGLARGHWR
jgi:hypothetical protein